MRLIILGPPGSGKGTQSELLSKDYNIPTISVGALLREEVKFGTEIGLEANKYMEKGEWVPHEITFEVLRKRLEKKDVENGFIIDAFPRLSAEYHQLGVFLLEKGWTLDAVISLNVSDIECLRRIQARAEFQATKGVYRQDNREEVILQRLKVHHETVQDILEYYKEAGLLIEIDANDPIGIVHSKIKNALSLKLL